jgi:hypothetical protein
MSPIQGRQKTSALPPASKLLPVYVAPSAERSVERGGVHDAFHPSTVPDPAPRSEGQEARGIALSFPQGAAHKRNAARETLP